MSDVLQESALPLVLVTGPSGSGRATAIRALEDIGFEAIDNLPFTLLKRLVAGGPLKRPLALGLDVRNRDFSTQGLLEAMEMLSQIKGLSPELLFLDCQPNVLLRRYNETRRQHPMSPTENPQNGINLELELLQSVRVRADTLIDTTDLTPHNLRVRIEELYGKSGADNFVVTVKSFSYRRGLPQGVDTVFDCRFLRNPHWDPKLRSLDGRDSGVGAYVANDKNFDAFILKLTGMFELLLPAYVAEGRSHLGIGFGCTGGQHRSVFVAERVAQTLAHDGVQVSIRHRELERLEILPVPNHKP